MDSSGRDANKTSRLEEERWRFRKGVAWRSLVALLVLGLLALGVLVLVDQQRFAQERETTLREEIQRLRSVTTLLAGDIDFVVGRARIIAHLEEMERYLQQPSPEHLRQLQEELLNVARYGSVYDTIELMGPQGRPLLQVEQHNGEARLRPPAQSPERQAPWVLAMADMLEPGEVYVSPLLPRVDGEHSQHILVLARSENEGAQEVILLLAYPMSRLLQRLEVAIPHRRGELSLVNSDGSALMPGGPPQLVPFAREYPEAWPLVRMMESGAVESEHGILAFSTMTIAGGRLQGQPSASPVQRWKLVSLLPTELLTYNPAGVFTRGRFGMIIAGILLLPISLIFGWLRTSNVHQSRALRLSEERLSMALEGANEGIWDWGPDGRGHVSRSWTARLGLPTGGLASVEAWNRHVHPDDLEDVRRRWQQSIERREAFEARYRMITRDGRELWALARGRPVFDSRDHLRVVGTIVDVTAEVEAEEKLREAAAAIEGVSDAIIILDRKGCITATNAAFVDITGFSREEAVGRRRELLGADYADPALVAQIDQALAESGRWRGELKARRKDGELFPTQLNVRAIRTGPRELTRYVSVLSDISAIKHSEERLSRLAHHDTLTELPNRLLFNASLEQALHRAERHQQRLALMFLDLDRFKQINDRLGHAAGDELLRTVARRLQHSVRTEDTVARLGGDEFTVILEDLDDPEDAAPPAEKIIAAVSQPLALAERMVTPSTSLGIALYPDDGLEAEQLIRAADAAMYRAKQAGRNNYQFFTADLTAHASHRLEIEEGLRHALEAGELTIVYQPQVRLPDYRVVGAEALVRWRHPREGLLSPREFLDIAEETGLIEPLGEWVLEEICRQIAIWRASGLPPLRLGVNLTLRQLHSRRGLQRAIAQIARLRLAKGELQLDLEIAENALDQAHESLELLRELHALGVGLAIDDFGTGCSSLSSLKRFPVDLIKIDRSFVRDLPSDPLSQAITRAVLALGESLQLKVLAEGVETRAQLDFLIAAGCSELQGFLFSHPVSAEQLAEYARASGLPPEA